MFHVTYSLLWFEVSLFCKGSYCDALDPRATHYQEVIDRESVNFIDGLISEMFTAEGAVRSWVVVGASWT